MTTTPIDRESVKQALAELEDVVRCRCHEACRGRGLHDPDCQCDSADAVATVRAALDAAEAENKRLREALTPSGDTKAAYMAEIECDCPTETWRHFVPWTSIKQIMAMIRARAALQENPDG